MMPIRFPTEAANDPDGKLNGLPESTGEDDANRGRADGSGVRKDRNTNEPRSDEPKREKNPDRDTDEG